MRTLLLLTLILGGCVGKWKYLDLEASHAQTTASLTQAQADLSARDLRIAELEGEIVTLKGEITAATAKREALDAELREERRQKVELLQARAKLNASIEDMNRALEDLATRKAQAEASVAAFRDLLRRFQSLIDAGRLQVRILDGRMVVQLATDVLFSSGSASLSADGRAAIREVAAVLRDIPDRKFQVEGHTDDVPIRTERFPSNWELASARAITVVREMLEVGLPADRVSAASYGEFAPVAPNRTAEGKSANRRIQIVVVPDLAGLPGYDELQRASRPE